MFTTSKIRWLGSIILAGIFLALAVFGGKWGTNYAASASVNAAPVITAVFPSEVKAGSPDIVLIIAGTNFGTRDDTRVRLAGGAFDTRLLIPIDFFSGSLTVLVPADMLVHPNTYSLTVAKYVSGPMPTIPTIPSPPDWEISNSLPFKVLVFNYLPFISKNYTP